MALVGLAFVLLALGVVLLGDPGKRQEPIFSWKVITGSFSATLGLVWATQFLLPSWYSWLVLWVGALALVGIITFREPLRSSLQLVIGWFFAIVVFHLSIALLDVVLSTRTFASDSELLVAALDRGLSPASFVPTALVTVFSGTGAAMGLWLDSRLGKRAATVCQAPRH